MDAAFVLGVSAIAFAFGFLFGKDFSDYRLKRKLKLLVRNHKDAGKTWDDYKKID